MNNQLRDGEFVATFRNITQCYQFVSIATVNFWYGGLTHTVNDVVVKWI